MGGICHNSGMLTANAQDSTDRPAEEGPGSLFREGSLLRILGWVTVAGLVLTSIYLAVNRIFQVDEAQQVFQSVILARGQSSSFYTYAPLHHLGPMAWVAHHAGTAKDMFTWDRLIYLVVFWINLLLLARICAGGWRNRSFLPWLLFAATLEPVWDYGFEIRHDNLLLTGILLLWLLVRGEARRSWVTAGFTGLLAIVLQFIAFKAFLYWIPCTLAILLFPPPAVQPSGRLRLALEWLGGALLGLVLVRLAYALGGGWSVALEGFRGGVSVSASVERFSPFPALFRMVSQTPLVVALGMAAAAAAIHRWVAEGRSFVGWGTAFPELVLLTCLLASFLANPTPFPYNLLFLAPFLLIAGAGLVRRVLPERRPAVVAMAVATAAFCHFVPFLSQTYRHFGRTNDRQEELMTLAERMTDPARDRVFDGTGLVPTRATVGYHWLVHSLTLRHFQDGSWPSVRELLEKNPAPIVIPNYRTNWLPAADRSFLTSHYVALADDFLVLGSTMPSGGGTYVCLQPGRYEIMLAGPPEAGKVAPIEVDGRAVAPESVLNLTRGPHEVRTESPARAIIVWLGPSLDKVPRLAPGSHLNLFVNWY